jgi:acyl carrier protein
MIKIMDIKDFIKNFAAQFEETDSAVFAPNTKFRELDEWSSMTTLSIIAMADEEYGVELEAADLKAAQTINDLFEIIKAKQK